ncbi:DUF3099 domain-containing protein [Isoptericola sp. NPDC019482]|uniref:DUF3099 domain-containing protein n=1 Tax=Isoptericola sp. NPDC019482 TaxID=3154688 RepID=UPI00346C19FF
MSNARATSPGPRPSGGRRHGADQGAEVPSITSAPEPLEEDQARRTHRYLVQMGIRVICFLGAIAVGDTWVRWVLVVAAVVLPYSAVLFANAGRDRVSYDTSPMVDVAPTELTASTQEPAQDDAAPHRQEGSGPETFDGPHRVVEHQDDPADENEDTNENPGGTR